MSEMNNPKIDAISQSIFQITEIMAKKAVLAANEESGNDGTMPLFVAIAAAGGSLRVLAEVISKRDGDSSDKEAMLVAALIAGRTVMPHKDGVTMDFTPRNVLAALEAANKIAGKDLSSFVDDRMLLSYREGVAKESLTLGYWDYVRDVGPDFEGFDGLNDYMKSFSRH